MLIKEFLSKFDKYSNLIAYEPLWEKVKEPASVIRFIAL